MSAGCFGKDMNDLPYVVHRIREAENHTARRMDTRRLCCMNTFFLYEALLDNALPSQTDGSREFGLWVEMVFLFNFMKIIFGQYVSHDRVESFDTILTGTHPLYERACASSNFFLNFGGASLHPVSHETPTQRSTSKQ